MPENCIYSYKTEKEPVELLDPEASAWKDPLQTAAISLLWNGKAPRTSGPVISGRVASFWTAESIFFHFRCGYEELHVNRDYPADCSVEGLWDYDVAEVFLQPPGCSGYLEYEVSPLSQFLAAHIITPWKNVDFSWDSGMKARALLREEASVWNAVIELPIQPMLKAESFHRPVAGDIWRANMFLALGAEPSRHYLCWQPTLTETPNFHVPEAFGCLLFRE